MHEGLKSQQSAPGPGRVAVRGLMLCVLLLMNAVFRSTGFKKWRWW